MYCHESIRKLAQNISTHKNYISVGVLASGFGSNLQELINFSKISWCKYKIKYVFTNKSNSYAINRAQQENILHKYISHKNYDSRQKYEEEIIKLFNSHQIDLIILAGFMRILSPYFLDYFAPKIINIHPSLLPKYPGLDVIKKAYKNNEKFFGCTVHIVDHGVDTGPILGQARYTKKTQDNISSITNQVHILEHKLLPEIVQNIAEIALMN